MSPLPRAAEQSSLADSSEFVRLADWIELLDRMRDTCRIVQEKLRQQTGEAADDPPWWLDRPPAAHDPPRPA